MNVNLILFKKDGEMAPFSLINSVTVIGRHKGCDLCIPLMAVSRKHCQLYIHQKKLMVWDLSSRNGTYVNEQKIDEAHIKAGDHLRIGPLIFGIQIDGIPKDISTMWPENLLSHASHAGPEPMQQSDEAFEKMIRDFSDYDLNQTLSLENPVDMDVP